MKRYVYAAALCLIAGGISACAATKNAEETGQPPAVVNIPAKQPAQVQKKQRKQMKLRRPILNEPSKRPSAI